MIEALGRWNGELVEVPYTQGISSSQLQAAMKEVGTTADVRLKSLARLINAKPIVRLLEIHNGLSGLIIENIHVDTPAGRREFDGMWPAASPTPPRGANPTSRRWISRPG